jgi:hypothetical protein
VKLRNLSRVEIESEEFRQSLDTKWPASDGDTLENSVGELRVCLANFPQAAFVCLVESLWQFGQGTLDTTWVAAAKIGKLTVHPTEPT